MTLSRYYTNMSECGLKTLHHAYKKVPCPLRGRRSLQSTTDCVIKSKNREIRVLGAAFVGAKPHNVHNLPAVTRTLVHYVVPAILQFLAAAILLTYPTEQFQLEARVDEGKKW